MNQNSMKQMSEKERKIDSRTAGEIEDRIEELAASYVPEWHFDREHPDIGSVIGKLFAGQMEGNIVQVPHGIYQPSGHFSAPGKAGGGHRAPSPGSGHDTGSGGAQRDQVSGGQHGRRGPDRL